MLQACLNGNREAHEHHSLPTTPESLAHAARTAVDAGAESIHLHPKDEAGADSLAATDVERCVGAVRDVVDVPIGVTTGAWIESDPLARRALIATWTITPSFASVNWHEDGADDVADLLLDRGIGVEAGLFHAVAAERWTRYEQAARCLRVLVELPDEDDVLGIADDILSVVESSQPKVPILLHGSGSSCWPALRYAGRRGLNTRIGFEDTLVLSTGRVAESNGDLVTHARALLSQA